MGPEPIVLPLNDPPTVSVNLAHFRRNVKGKKGSSSNHFPAPHRVTIPHWMESDFFSPAAIFDQRASSLKLATGRRVEGARHIPFKFFRLLGAFLFRGWDG
jgi:hypothetical protein